MKFFATLAIAAALTVTSSATDEVETTYPSGVTDKCKYDKLMARLREIGAKKNRLGVKVFTEAATDS